MLRAIRLLKSESVDAADARQFAFRLLADDVPERWLHVQGVAATAKRFAPLLEDWETLVMAGYLHDIGYSPKLPKVGFHPLDGARYLRDHGWPHAVVNLVANHSNAEVQARIRGFDHLLEAEFPYDPDLPHRYLQYCDLSVDTDGRPVSLDKRLAGMFGRHSHNEDMTAHLHAAEPRLRQLVFEIDDVLSRAAMLDSLSA